MYVPSLEELLDGLHRMMTKSVVPMIDDEFARAAANQVCDKLKEIASIQSIVDQWATLESEEMREALVCCLALIDTDPRISHDKCGVELRTIIDTAVRTEFLPDQRNRSTTSLLRENEVLARATEVAIPLLYDLQRRLPASQVPVSAREEIRRVIRLQAQRRDPDFTD